ncbi:MAG: hypothetical protein JWO20_1956 [Candidatus Angelobacter sp.]|jgi:hypothetical protein|nr:hypothetical protein [Candidatus Angelobacter sp.]
MIRQFSAGDQVPEAGTYRVYHYRHRMPHLVNTLLVQFPQCSKCKEKVRFELATISADAAEKWLRHDPDFQDTASGIALRKKASLKGMKRMFLSMLSFCMSF